MRADILGARFIVEAVPSSALTVLTLREASLSLDPDEARMLGVRLIESAALSDGERAIRTVEN